MMASSKTAAKSSAKGAHGGGNKFSQVLLGNGFKNMAKAGINSGKPLAKTKGPKKSPISENRVIVKPVPTMVFGKGFVFTESTKTKTATKSKKSSTKKSVSTQYTPSGMKRNPNVKKKHFSKTDPVDKSVRGSYPTLFECVVHKKKYLN